MYIVVKSVKTKTKYAFAFAFAFSIFITAKRPRCTRIKLTKPTTFNYKARGIARLFHLSLS